jgi:acetyl esterase
MAPRRPQRLEISKLWPSRLQRTAAATSVMHRVTRRLVGLQRPVPLANRERYGVTYERNIEYVRGSKENTVDIYRPVGRTDTLPVLMYVHGGGFHMLSKDSHWPLTVAYARQGFLVVSVDYRLAPKHPYPAAIADVCAAAVWVKKNIARYGGDPEQITFAGESAGGNLVTALTVACSFERDELYARAVYEANIQPKAVIAACGILQVSDPGRFRRRRNGRIPPWVNMYIHMVCGTYLGGKTLKSRSGASLADPLLILEEDTEHTRPLPPFHAFVGTKDPLIHDTRRLAAALERRGTTCDDRYYKGGIHAFHVLLFQKIARDCWQEQFRFLKKHMPRAVPAEGELAPRTLETLFAEI